MTDEQIREMISGIINNDEKWECHGYDKNSGGYPLPWKPYKLGDEIHDDWEYRKVETWYVLYGNDCYPYYIDKSVMDGENIFFTGTKEECEKWIEEHTKETWLDETFPLGLIVGDLHMEGEKERLGAKEVCKKILEEVEKNVVFKDFNNYEHGKALCITLDKLEKIIKDLGVNVW